MIINVISHVHNHNESKITGTHKVIIISGGILLLIYNYILNLFYNYILHIVYRLIIIIIISNIMFYTPLYTFLYI